MTLKEAKQLSKFKPLLADLPRHLQKKENYRDIQKKLFGILQSTHSHAEVYDWFNCKSCMERYEKYKQEKKKLGFISTNQWMKWEKVHHI